MRVRLAPELFQAPVADLLLTTVFQYALDGRHHIEADLAHPVIAEWLQQQSVGLQEQITLAVDLSAEAEALQPSRTVAEIGMFVATDFAATPIRLRPANARAFLERPFSLLLEDEISDRDFVLKMLTDEERKALQERIDRGFVRVQHGGGLPNMRRHLLDRQGDPALRHTIWVLFDSDAMQPGIPSAQSEALRAVCGGIPHHQLRCRYMESYLPARALNGWAARGRDHDERTERFALLRGFLRMQPVQRHHFNMKRGFAGDEARTDATAGTLYDDVTDKDRTVLTNGFGTTVGALFGGADVTESDLRRDSGWSELRPVIQELLAQVR